MEVDCTRSWRTCINANHTVSFGGGAVPLAVEAVFLAYGTVPSAGGAVLLTGGSMFLADGTVSSAGGAVPTW